MKKNGSGWWWKEGVLGFCFLNELWRLSMKMEGQDGFSKKWVWIGLKIGISKMGINRYKNGGFFKINLYLFLSFNLIY